ncbi:MAG: ribosome biogenesis GTP-binding protein YihA/YsxC [Bacteroidota bacterium]
MNISKAIFVKSSSDYRDCPQENKPEYAFIGRSNVGKSSLINMLSGTKKLAKTSGRPGKTQLINHFLMNDNWYIADLPGFGFAKVPMKIKTGWDKMIKNYLLKRKNLVYTFLLIDIRHDPQRNDLEFMEWFAVNQLPFIILFTKSDKLSSQRLQETVEKYTSRLADQWDPLPEYIISSAETKTGKETILDFIEKNNRHFYDDLSSLINW